MKKLNVNITDDFRKDLEDYMRARGISTKADALRQALREAVTAARRKGDVGYQEWLGLGLKAPLRHKRRFQSEDDLWS